MADLAITEHLAFAYALCGEARYGDAARDWVLASCRAWKREADDEPNGSKAYAVCRLLKGLAVGYDLAFDRFSDAERDEVRGTLLAHRRQIFRRIFLHAHDRRARTFTRIMPWSSGARSAWRRWRCWAKRPRPKPG